MGSDLSPITDIGDATLHHYGATDCDLIATLTNEDETMNAKANLKPADSQLSDADRAVQLEVITHDLIAACSELTGSVTALRGHHNSVTALQRSYLASQPTVDHVARTLRTIVNQSFPFATCTQKENPDLYRLFRSWRDTFVKQGIELAETTGYGYALECKRETGKDASGYIISVSPLVAAQLEQAKQRAIADDNAAADRAKQDEALAKEARAAEIQRTPISQLAVDWVEYARSVFPGADMLALIDAARDVVTMDLAAVNK